MQQCSVSCAALRSPGSSPPRDLRQANPPPSWRYQHGSLPMSSWTRRSRKLKFKASLSKPLRRTSESRWQTGHSKPLRRTASSWLPSSRFMQQVAPPLSGVEQTEPKDKIAAIFDESVRSPKAFSGELLHDLKHRLSRDRASSLPARGDQDCAPDGHLGKPATQQKRTRRRGGRRCETRRAARRTAREEATQARANIKEATDCEEAPPTDSEARQRGRGETRPADSEYGFDSKAPRGVADIEDSEARQRGRGERPEARQRGRHRGFRGPTAWPRREEARKCGQLQGPRVAWPTSRPASCVADFKARQLRGRRATRSGGGRA